MRPKVVLLMDAYDQRVHEGAARFFQTIAEDVELIRPHDNPLGAISFYCLDALGVIVSIAAREHVDSATKDLKNLQCPIVSVGSVTDELEYPAVIVDDRELGRMAAAYFLQHKFRRFAAICQALSPGHRERINGFTEHLESRGESALVCDDFDPEDLAVGWHRYVIDNIGGAPKPLAVLATDDRIGTSVMRHCQPEGVRIPEEVAVLGVGNDHMVCDYAPLPLSSIDVNSEQMGWASAEMLWKLMKGKRPPAKPKVVPPLGIVERRSTEIVSAEDPRAMRALRLIMDNLGDGLRASDIARAVKLSTSQLDRIFLGAFSRTVKQEQTRLRMQRARELLATTDMPAKAIAGALGFRTMAHMSRVFAQEHGTTIQQFRKKLHAGRPDRWEDSLSAARLIPRDDMRHRRTKKR